MYKITTSEGEMEEEGMVNRVRMRTRMRIE